MLSKGLFGKDVLSLGGEGSDIGGVELEVCMEQDEVIDIEGSKKVKINQTSLPNRPYIT